MARIRTAEANVHRLVTGVNPEADDEDDGGDDDGAGRVDEEEQNSGMDSDDVDDKFHELEEAVAVLVADVHDLAVSFSCSHFLPSQSLTRAPNSFIPSSILLASSSELTHACRFDYVC